MLLEKLKAMTSTELYNHRLKLLEERNSFIKKKKELISRSSETKDIKELRQINGEMDEYSNKLELITSELNIIDSLNGEHFVPGGEKRTSEAFNPTSIYGQRNLNLIATYNLGSNPTQREISNGIFLRNNESFFDRVVTVGENQNNIDLGKYIRGAVTGKWENADFEKRAFSTSTMGVLIPSVCSAQVIDHARNVSLFTKANVKIAPMETDNLTIARVKDDPEFYFKEELAEAKKIEFDIEPIKLKSKTCYGYAYVSLETIRSAANLSEILIQVFGQAIANSIDKAFIYGQYNDETSSYDSFAPSGIINDESVHSVVGGNGWDDIIKALGKVRGSNGDPKIYAINSNTQEQLSLLKTNDGQYLDKPKVIESLTEIITNQLNHNDSTGNDALVFDPRALIIGIQNNIVIRMITDSDYCLKNGAVGFQIYSMIDCQSVTPKHICKITGMKNPS